MFRLLLANRPVGITGTRLLNLRRVLRGRVQEPVEGRGLAQGCFMGFPRAFRGFGFEQLYTVLSAFIRQKKLSWQGLLQASRAPKKNT